jgi:hypothetical protein
MNKLGINVRVYLHIMKTPLLFFALVILAFSAFSQSISFPTDNAIWVNTEYVYTFNPPNPIPASTLNDVDMYCMNGQDTSIQSNTYTQVFYCGDAYKGAIRDDNGIVYFVPADSVSEYLLYDFTAQANQTLQNVYVGNHFDETFILQDFTVQQIGIEFVGGMNRRVVYADNFRWIEGIGCETGLFMEPWQNVSMYSVYLECMSVNGNTLFPTDGTGDCSLTVGIDKAIEKKLSVSVYPNPNIGVATLQFGSIQTQVNVSILNNLGQQIESFITSNTAKVELNLAAPSGIYFVKVVSADGLNANLRIVKH